MFNNVKKIIKALCIVSFFSFATVGNVQAQLGDAGEILRAGADDANIYLSEFLSPFSNGFGASLNTGWFTTANSHSTLGFELNLNVGVAMVPSTALEIDVSSLGMSNLEVTSGSNTTPTISGEDNTNTKLGQMWTNPQTNQQEPLFEFDAPSGIAFEYVPAPMAQLTVGVIKDTDVSLRFVPTTALGDFGELGLFGFGVKHGINQWIPGGKVLPVDLSVQFGYTSFNMSTDFEVDPETGNDIYNPYNASQWDGQGLEMETSAYTINAIVGKKLPIIAVYGGIGIEGTTTTLGSPGAYPLTVPNSNYDPTSSDPAENRQKVIESLSAPIDLEMEGENNFRAFAGFRVKLAVIQLFANYTLSTYPTANAGFGFTFR